MSKTPDIHAALVDEALEPAPTQQALACILNNCSLCTISTISDEPLDQAPAKEAAICASCYVPCYVSDEPLDPAPAQQAAVCYCVVCVVPCGISDEDVATR